MSHFSVYENIKEIEIDGVEMTVCKVHHQELCHRCGVDYREIHAMERMHEPNAMTTMPRDAVFTKGTVTRDGIPRGI